MQHNKRFPRLNIKPIVDGLISHISLEQESGVPCLDKERGIHNALTQSSRDRTRRQFVQGS